MAKLKKGKQKGADQPRFPDPPNGGVSPAGIPEVKHDLKPGQPKAGFFREEFSQEGSVRQDESIHGRLGTYWGSGDGAITEADDDGWEAGASAPNDGWGTQGQNTPLLHEGTGAMGGDPQDAAAWGGSQGGETPGGWQSPRVTVLQVGGGAVGAKDGRSKKKGATAQGGRPSPSLTIPPPPPAPPPPPFLAAAVQAAMPSATKRHRAHHQADAGWDNHQASAIDGWDAPADGWGAQADGLGAHAGARDVHPDGWGAQANRWGPQADGWDAQTDGWGNSATKSAPRDPRAAPAAPPPVQTQTQHPAIAAHAKSAWSKWAAEAKLRRKVAAAAAVPVPPAPAPPATGVAPGKDRNGSAPQNPILHPLLPQLALGMGVPAQQQAAHIAHMMQQGNAQPSQQVQAQQLRQRLQAELELRQQQLHMRQQQLQQQRGRQRDDHRQHQAHIQAQPYRPPQVAQSDSWGSTGWGNEAAYSSDWADTIPEEDEGEEEEEEEEEEAEEEEDEEEGWEEVEEEQVGEEDDYYGYRDYGDSGHRVRFSEGNVANARARADGGADEHWQAKANSDWAVHGGVGRSPAAMGNAKPLSVPLPAAAVALAPATLRVPSKTMVMAVGRGATVFDHERGTGTIQLVESYWAAIEPAEIALFGNARPAKERIYWGLSAVKDERVSSLLNWITVVANGLATLGLQKFLQTGDRGALISNADYRANAPGAPLQPAFDWITIGELQRTLDHILQQSVRRYDPAVQVVVFVFLLSRSGNSIAVWRRKLDVPEAVRLAHQGDISRTKELLKSHYDVYVEKLPVKSESAPEHPKKRGFFRRLFRWW